MCRFIRISFVVAIVGLLAWLGGCAGESATSAEAPPAVVEPAPTPATYWPVGLNTPDGELVMYQPQPDALQGDQLSARAAVSWTPAGGQPMYGTAEFKARIATDRDTRMVDLQDIASIQLHLPGATAQQEQQFATVAQHELPGMGIAFPLDQLLASLDTAPPAVQPVGTAQPAPGPAPALAPADGFNNEPPKIIFSSVPATLISVSGPPKLLPVDDHPGVQEVVNTPFIMLYDPAGKRYYLKAGTRWVSAAEMTGQWNPTTDVPAEIAAAGDFLATPPPAVATTEPATGAPAQPAASRPSELAEAAADTKIIVSTDPAELIATQGSPQFTPIPGGQLLYCSNSDANLFLYQPTQRYYLLLGGRWYIAPAILGPWQYLAAAALPGDFANIPPDSPKANVLASVPGTTTAREAVLDAEIPQTASVRRDAGNDLSVSYDGPPRFQQIGNGPVSYALNTPNSVVSVNGVYYCCDDAVWYQSPAPTGPWTVCVSVPPAIYSIPPSCPLYNVTYCYVYDSTPSYVYCGYLPGYTGCYVQGSTVVYGTGYNYGGWYGSAYFPYACTWGFSAVYDPWTCDWGFGLGFYWNTGWFAHQWHNGWWRHHWHQIGRHDPWLGRWWGPHGYVNYNRMRTHDAALRTGGQHGDEFGGAGRRNIYRQPRNVARNITSQNRRLTGTVMPNRANDLFAGHDGNVFRRNDAGWETRGQANWSRDQAVPGAQRNYQPRDLSGGRAYAPPSGGMDRDYAARARGEYRANTVQHFGEFHGGGGSRGGGGGGGGGARGGGGGGAHGGGGGRR